MPLKIPQPGWVMMLTSDSQVLHLLEFSPGGGFDVSDSLLLIVDRAVMLREVRSQVHLLCEPAEREVVLERPVVGNEGAYRLPVCSTETLAHRFQRLFRGRFFVCEVSDCPPAALRTLPRLIVVSVDEAEDGRRAIRHHIHVHHASDRNGRGLRGVIGPLEDPAEASEPRPADVDDGDSMLRQVSAENPSQRG